MGVERMHLLLSAAGAEIVAQGVQRVRLHFGELLAELLFDAIDRVEKRAPVHVQLASAQFPVGAEQEIKAEYFLFERLECAFRGSKEICNIFLVFTAQLPPLPAAPCRS